MEDGDDNPCFFPPCNVERIGNILLIHCGTEDDAVVAYEIFREIAVGRSVWIGRADSEPER